MDCWLKKKLVVPVLLGLLGGAAAGQTGSAVTYTRAGASSARYGAVTDPREDLSLDNGWRTVASATDSNAYRGFTEPGFSDTRWKSIDVPHNWDAYGGYRRLRHGNLHGYAWYRRWLTIDNPQKGRRYFLWFEGVSSYATVWVDGRQVGYHAGGRTSFTLDITPVLQPGRHTYLLAVRADHPAFIRDLPWVCGGCSDERGFSEGSQPMGIFRPVHLIVTNDLRVTPFGVHIWNDTTVTTHQAALFLETEIKNYRPATAEPEIVNRLLDRNGVTIAITRHRQIISPGQMVTIPQKIPSIPRPHLWSVSDPYLYTLVTGLVENGRIIDRVITPYGIRRIRWPDATAGGGHPFLLNGKPVFINGIAEYEHRLGQSHAFSATEIRARVMQIKAAGFNAFRDAHQPHNLRYQAYWDKLGMLWWPQLSAHIWYDSPAFRQNFKTLLIDWVKERRNSPSLVLWGLQNESKLPEDFARECTKLIRELDPTASSQRKITTCNGGSGTDWDIPQNWTGTYGGDPATYAADLRRQVLVGEYGAWRTLDDHAEAPYGPAAAMSEDRMSQLMETKIRLAETVKDQVAGHFAWLYASHDNPGRVQSGEGWRELDRIGPVNYKGLLSSWEEPTDAYYLYRSNYAPKETSPMVYIVSHTWPDRWTSPGKKSGIIVYSNCDEVELFNDVHRLSLGRRRRKGIGSHFQWDSADIRYNVLYAVGYVNGKEVARDYIVLHHLPPAPHVTAFFTGDNRLTAPQPGYHYIYRVNCGGPDYTDSHGHVWMADRHLASPAPDGTGTDGIPAIPGSSMSGAAPAYWGSTSWTDDYPGLPPFFASQRRTDDPIAGTEDGPLFQDFRYGLDRLGYSFPVQDGDYRVELYFVEPWLGTGGGLDCTGWRLFDVVVNDSTVIKDLDLWKEAGHDKALKRTVRVHITGGRLVISFPHAVAGQAIICAIAIATLDGQVQPAPASPGLIGDWTVREGAEAGAWRVGSWLDTGDPQYTGDAITFSSLPPNLYGAEWIRGPGLYKGEEDSVAHFRVTQASDVFIGIDARIKNRPDWLKDYEDTKTSMENDAATGNIFKVFRKRFPAGATVWLGRSGGEDGGAGNAGTSGGADRPMMTGGVAGVDPHPRMYTVVVCPATTLEPAYDSKPVTTYKDGNTRGDTTEWNIAVGVGDVYSLTIRYRYLPAGTASGRLEVRSEDGSLLKEEKVSFSMTLPTKWNDLNSSTGTMINAGHYTIRLIADHPEGLTVRELQVQ